MRPPTPVERGQQRLHAYMRPARWALCSGARGRGRGRGRAGASAPAPCLGFDELVEVCDHLLQSNHKDLLHTVSCVCTEWLRAAREALETVRSKLAVAGAAVRVQKEPWAQQRMRALEAVRHAGLGMSDAEHREHLRATQAAFADRDVEFHPPIQWVGGKDNPYERFGIGGGGGRGEGGEGRERGGLGDVDVVWAFVALCHLYRVPPFRVALVIHRIHQSGFFPTRMSAWGFLTGGCELCGVGALDREGYSWRACAAPLLVPACDACVRSRAVLVAINQPFAHQWSWGKRPNQFTVDDVEVRAHPRTRHYTQRSVGTLYGRRCLERARRAHRAASSPRSAIGRRGGELVHRFLSRSNLSLRFTHHPTHRMLFWVVPPPLNAAVGQRDQSLFALLRVRHCEAELQRAQRLVAREVARDREAQREHERVRERLGRQFVVHDPTRHSRNVSIAGIHALYKLVENSMPIWKAVDVAWGGGWWKWTKGIGDSLVRVPTYHPCDAPDADDDYEPLNEMPRNVLLDVLARSMRRCTALQRAVRSYAMAGQSVRLGEEERRAVLDADDADLFETVNSLWRVFAIVHRSPTALASMPLLWRPPPPWPFPPEGAWLPAAAGPRSRLMTEAAECRDWIDAFHYARIVLRAICHTPPSSASVWQILQDGGRTASALCHTPESTKARSIDEILGFVAALCKAHVHVEVSPPNPPSFAWLRDWGRCVELRVHIEGVDDATLSPAPLLFEAGDKAALDELRGLVRAPGQRASGWDVSDWSPFADHIRRFNEELNTPSPPRGSASPHLSDTARKRLFQLQDGCVLRHLSKHWWSTWP